MAADIFDSSCLADDNYFGQVNLRSYHTHILHIVYSMKIFSPCVMLTGACIRTLPFPVNLHNSIAAIGNFDGVHRGHQAVISATRQNRPAQRMPLGGGNF